MLSKNTTDEFNTCNENVYMATYENSLSYTGRGTISVKIHTVLRSVCGNC